MYGAKNNILITSCILRAQLQNQQTTDYFKINRSQDPVGLIFLIIIVIKKNNIPD